MCIRDRYYSADDKAGNSLTISFDADDEEMDISITAAKEESDKNSSVDNSSAETDIQGSEVEEEEKNETETNNNETDSNEADNNQTDNNENVEFREWVDSYEEFMNRYVEFMENYDSSDASAVLEYTELVSKYSEFIEATGNLNEDDYSVSDWAYYTAAQARVLDRLSKIQ